MDLLLPRKTHIRSMTFTIAFMFFSLHITCLAQNDPEDEETYSISLVQTAEIDSEIHEVDGKKVYTESYTVKEGDYIWKILRNKGLEEKKNFYEIVSILKKLNKNLNNIDLIHPGESIIIPLVIAPIGTDSSSIQSTRPARVSVRALEDLNSGIYTIKPGDSLIKVIKNFYDIPLQDLHDEYLNLFKEMNPSIDDLDLVYPGQKIRLPVYSPKVVRMPVKVEPEKKPINEEWKKERKEVGRQLGDIFSEIGEDWISTGKHFIPLKTGGQVNLDADSYPIAELRNGNRLVVDLYNNLPEKMVNLITSSWNNYRIVHLSNDLDLKGSISLLLAACEYQKVFKPGEPLKLGGDIPLKITADWIINTGLDQPGENSGIIVLNLIKDMALRTPESIRIFLKGIGIKTIDYPFMSGVSDEFSEELDILEAGGDPATFVGQLLTLAGISYSENNEIPIYQKTDASFNLIVKADFSFTNASANHIIDLSGLGPDIISLLIEHKFSILSINPHDPYPMIVTQVLKFLGIEFDSNPQPFLVFDGSKTRNIQLTIPGIIFNSSKDHTIFASQEQIPIEIISLINHKGYTLFDLTNKKTY